MIVDANIPVYWAVPGGHSVQATAIMSRPGLAAPGIILPETANALLKHARAGTIAYDGIAETAETIGSAIETLVPDAILLPDAIAIAIAEKHKIYDCLYLALAARRGEALVTADRRMAALARKLAIETELIEPSL